MATTVAERKLFIAGDWVETGAWIEVRSPYSGDVVGRVAKGGADETKHAIDAAERARSDPLPAHKRAEILVKVVAGIARRHDEIARQISDEAGKPLKAARVEASRAMSTYTFAAVEAPADRGRGGADGRGAGRRGKARLHAAAPDRRRRRNLALQLPAQPRRAQARPGARGRLPRRAEARDADAALGAPARRRATKTRRACRRAGSASSSAPRRRSATCSSRTSA